MRSILRPPWPAIAGIFYSFSAWLLCGLPACGSVNEVGITAGLEAGVRWSRLSDSASLPFSGTAVYTISLPRPAAAARHCRLDPDSPYAIAGIELTGTLGAPLYYGDELLPAHNEQEIYVTNGLAHRSWDTDRRGLAGVGLLTSVAQGPGTALRQIC